MKEESRTWWWTSGINDEIEDSRMEEKKKVERNKGRKRKKRKQKGKETEKLVGHSPT